MQFIQRGQNAWVTLRLRGIGYLWDFTRNFLAPRALYALFYQMPRARLRWLIKLGIIAITLILFLLLSWMMGIVAAMPILVGIGVAGWVSKHVRKGRMLGQMQREARLLLGRVQTTYDENTFTAWEQWPVDTTIREQVEAYLHEHPDEEVVLGSFDQDGRVLGEFGVLPWCDVVASDEFVDRHRFPLDIVLVEDKVLVRKDFQAAKERFIREWYNLVYLSSIANVPAVYKVDEDQCVLYKNLIAGRTLRSMLVEAGANILTVQTDQDLELAPLAPEARIKAVWQRGHAYLEKCVPASFLCVLEQQMNRIHACGVAGLSLTFGNVMMDEVTQSPWLIDMEGAAYYPSTTQVSFLLRRDQDREKFNQIYNRTLLTERTARESIITELKTKDSWYAPIDFGRGLAVGGIWSVESGTGRWEVLNQKVIPPLVHGKKVLDLGSNNGLLPLMMLRAGATEVVGVEMDPVFVERARLVHRIFEWRDMRNYAFQIEQNNMLHALGNGVASFDVVTAFCSLYYLSEAEMASAVRKASAQVPILILQANDNTRKEAAKNKAIKSSTAFLEKLMRDNGYPSVKVYAPAGYNRPLLVGTHS